MDIEPIEIGGQHFVTINMDGRELNRRGPFPSAVVAQAMAAQLRELLEIPKNDVDVDELASNHDFVSDLARFSEGLCSQATIKNRWHFTDDVWSKLGTNDTLVEKIEAEKLRRIRNGASKRERAQQLVVKAPNVLDAILMDNSASPKHRIDAAKTLDGFAAPEPRAAHDASEERYVITINPGADQKLVFNKKIAPDPNDIDPNDVKTIDRAPQELIPMIAANKREENGGGQPL